MFVDTSAIIAAITNEPNAIEIERTIQRTPNVVTSPVVRLETTMVLAQKLQILPKEAEIIFNKFLLNGEIEIVPISDEIGSFAVEAYEKFGKGRHPARLNLADCFSYAVAKSLKVPLLFVGNDFSQTDIKSAL
jgi:ribonuclease VapC